MVSGVLSPCARICGAGSRPDDRRFLRFQEVVNLHRKGADLIGKCRPEPHLSPGTNVMKLPSQFVERSQTYNHLRPGGDGKNGGEKRERRHQIGCESASCGMNFGSIDCDRCANVAAAEICRQTDQAFHDKKRGLARTENGVLMHLGVREAVRR